MEIRFPRKIRLGFRPVYGLTLRQLLYVAAFGTLGGLIILVGPLQGLGLIVRLVIGLAFVCIGLVLAFLPIGGMRLDDWFPIVLRYLLRPRRRVWRKRDVIRSPSRSPGAQPAAPLHTPGWSVPQPNLASVPVQTPAPIRAEKRVARGVIVMIEAAAVVALIALTFYLQQSGLAEVRVWLVARLWH